MKVKLTRIYVDDQERALRSYPDVLGFLKKTDVSRGPYPWLTVVSPEEPDGSELQLALLDDPEAKTYRQAQFHQGQPAARLGAFVAATQRVIGLTESGALDYADRGSASTRSPRVRS
jgi:hypothetical protein